MNASPWSKYFCASGLDVATDRVCAPRPVYWMTLDLDGLSVFVGSASMELGTTATAAESAINRYIFVDRMRRAPFGNSSCQRNSARPATHRRRAKCLLSLGERGPL